jgi:hypothetical protein
MTEIKNIDAISLGIQNLGHAVQSQIGVPISLKKDRPRPANTDKSSSSEESVALTESTDISEEDRMRKLQLNLDITQRREQARGKESQKKVSLPKARMYWNKSLKEFQTLAEKVIYLFYSTIYNINLIKMRGDPTNQATTCEQFIVGWSNQDLEDGIKDVEKLVQNEEQPCKRGIELLRTDNGRVLNANFRSIYAMEPHVLRKGIADNDFQIAELKAQIVAFEDNTSVALFALAKRETVLLQFRVIKDCLLQELSDRILRSRKANETSFEDFPTFEE